MSDDGEFGDRVRQSLSHLGAGAAELATPAPAAQIRDRARRRRQLVAAGTITAVLTVGGGAVLLGDLLPRSGTEPIVAPGATTSISISAGTTPTASASPVPSSTASATPPPSTTPPPTASPSPTGQPATEIPAGFTLPHEGETSDDPEFSDWETTEDLKAPWPWSVCGVDRYDGDAARTDHRQVARSGPETTEANVLAVWGDAEQAVDLMAQLRTAIQACVDDVGESGFVTTWELRELDVGGESFIAVSTSTDPTGEPASGGDQVGVVRVGTAVYATYVFADGRPAVDDQLAAEMEAELADMASVMCVFTVAGC